MKKKRRKTDHCLNCGRQMEPSFDYCPTCGQENNDPQISFGKLLRDFFANYFSLDSRFGRSIKPFFMRPGLLTREFMDGKRVKYANPIRLYLVVSLVHFFVMNLSLDNNATHNVRILDFDENVLADSLDNQTANLGLEYNDSLSAELDTASYNGEKYWPMSRSEWKIIRRLTDRNSPNYPVQQIEDSINNAEKPYMAAKTNRQIIKLMKADKHTINMFIVKNIPILMFFLLPIYALILKLFFRKRLYINHVIHGLHIHSFVFIVLTSFWLVNLFDFSWIELLKLAVFSISMLYVVLSFKNTYSLGWKPAILKSLASGAIYGCILAFGIISEVIISLYLF